MVRVILLVIILAFAAPASAENARQWVRDWWENAYEQRIQKEQYNSIRREEEKRCPTKVRWYREKVQANPESVYYQYKLDEWLEKCPEQLIQ